MGTKVVPCDVLYEDGRPFLMEITEEVAVVSLRLSGGMVSSGGLVGLPCSAVGMSGVEGGVIAVGELVSDAAGEARWDGSRGVSTVLAAGSSQDSGSALGRSGSCSSESWRCGSKLLFICSQRASPVEVEGGGIGGGGGEGGRDSPK